MLLKTLKKAQSLMTPLVLSMMGYNCNMPKAVIYAPTSHGGIGFCHLHSEQRLQKVLQIFKHLQTQTSLGTTIKLAIKAHQIHSGVALLISEYTDPIPWMSDHKCEIFPPHHSNQDSTKFPLDNTHNLTK